MFSFYKGKILFEYGFMVFELEVKLDFISKDIGILCYIALCFKFYWVFGGLHHMETKSFKFLWFLHFTKIRDVTNIEYYAKLIINLSYM